MAVTLFTYGGSCGFADIALNASSLLTQAAGDFSLAMAVGARLVAALRCRYLAVSLTLGTVFHTVAVAFGAFYVTLPVAALTLHFSLRLTCRTGFVIYKFYI